MARIKHQGNGAISFQCPGCGDYHTLPVVPGDRASWGWNGSIDKPTLTPSILVRSGHYASHWKAGDPCWCKFKAEHPTEEPDFECVICHSYITDGQIQFLSDCTHDLAGQTVSLREVA